jgi:arabinogalactan endo-1,4-beta-galactosidase
MMISPIRSLLATVILAILAAFVSIGSARAQSTARTLEARKLPPFLAGADISLLTAEEQHGQVYKDMDGRPRPLLDIFKAHGYNCVRLRLWVNPSEQGIFVNDLPYTVALGRRAKQAGFLLLLDFHYSDSWADPGKQFTPAAWANLPFDQLVTTMHDYSKSVIEAMRAGGAMPDIVQVGNEIPGGLLWPDGKDWGFGHDYKNLCILLKAGISGVKDGSGDVAPPLIMIHIDRGGDWAGTQSFFDNIDAAGVPYDIIGESYYPFFHGPMSGLKETLDNAALRYHRPIVVVETGYPYLSWPGATMGTTGRTSYEYPISPDGQKQFLQALVKTVEQTPDHLGKGVVYWAPEWIPARGLDGSWDGKTLFDDDGKALPGLDTLGEAGRKSSR